jgi:hypothetical protein
MAASDAVIGSGCSAFGTALSGGTAGGALGAGAPATRISTCGASVAPWAASVCCSSAAAPQLSLAAAWLRQRGYH